jgi:hypothetical protein
MAVMSRAARTLASAVSTRPALTLLVVTMALAGCSRGRPDDLWEVPTPKTPPDAVNSDVTGLWEGDVSMGGLRVRIEPERLTLALQCDSRTEKRSQAAAPIVFETQPEPRMVLREPLAGGDKECGFRFNAGDPLVYRVVGDGTLEVSFAGASVSRLVKVAELAAPR